LTHIPIRDLQLGLHDRSSNVFVDTTDYVRSLNLPPRLDGFYLKTEFHVCLIEFAENRASQELCEKITAASNPAAHFISDNPPRLNGQFRRAVHPIDDRESIIGLVDMPGFDKWCDAIRAALGGDTNFAVPHITLYTKQPDKGIGLYNQHEYDERTQLLEPEIVEKLRSYLT